jgi:3-methyl-2-oxobutanoate hydroxymethyltransferase
MSQTAAPRTLTLADGRARKGGEPFVCLTAATTPLARLLDPLCGLLPCSAGRRP